MPEERATAGAAPEHETAAAQGELYRRLGELTRTLHDALRELGHHRRIEQAVGSLPEARSRLSYIARLTGGAAEKVLNAVEFAKAEQSALAEAAAAAEEKLAGAGTHGDAASVSRELIGTLMASCARTDARLTEIMVAQEFHDLTGQVSAWLLATVERLEADLVRLLVDAAPAGGEAAAEPAGLAGPVTDPQRRADVMADQKQVDDLLESLGF